MGKHKRKRYTPLEDNIDEVRRRVEVEGEHPSTVARSFVTTVDAAKKFCNRHGIRWVRKTDKTSHHRHVEVR